MVKRLIFKMLVMVVIFTGVGIYVASIKGNDIRKALHVAVTNTPLPDLSWPDDVLPGPIALPAEETLIYKWKDAQGIWNFSADKPEGFGVEIIALTPDRNLVKATELKEKELPDNEREPESSQGQAFMEKNQEVLFPYSPDAVKQLIEDAKGVQGQLDDHYKRLEESVGN